MVSIKCQETGVLGHGVFRYPQLVDVFIMESDLYGNTSYNNLKNGDKLKALNGKELLVGVQQSKVTIDGVRIHTHDMKTTNGVVHGVDAVLKN